MAWQMAQEELSSEVESRGPPENAVAQLDSASNQIRALKAIVITLDCPLMNLSPFWVSVLAEWSAMIDAAAVERDHSHARKFQGPCCCVRAVKTRLQFSFRGQMTG
jgi:hypothetical protein